jgi:AhpD family alkylhydroperoxidase
MSITVMEKELIAVGISVAAGCKPCTDYHLKAARRSGALDDEIEQAIADAMAVREDATRIMEDYALGQLDEPVTDNDPARGEDTEETDRMITAVSLGAAFAVNCTSSLQRYLAAAESVDIPPEDIEKIVKLAVFIKGRAVSYVERLAGLAEEEAA